MKCDICEQEFERTSNSQKHCPVCAAELKQQYRQSIYRMNESLGFDPCDLDSFYESEEERKARRNELEKMD